MRQKTLAAAVALVVLATMSWTASAAAAGSITMYSAGLRTDARPERLVDGADGNVWFTDTTSPAVIGRITPGGTITEFSAGLNSGSVPWDLTLGPDGNVWFTDDSPLFGSGTAAIGRITPSGTITEFSEAHWENGEPAELAEPLEIVSGPDGNLWFTDEAWNGGQPAIGRITPGGTITLFKLHEFSQPRSIVVGPDGNLWFTNQTGSIGKITPSGEVTEYAMPEQLPEDIISGPDGDLWFTNLRGAIGRITPSGTITEYSAGLQPEAAPVQLVVGAEGNLWFTDGGGVTPGGVRHGEVGRITPSGTITEFGHDLAPRSIALGPDGNIWVTDERGTLDRFTPSGQLTSFWLGLFEADEPRDLIAGPGGDGIWFANVGGDGEGNVIGGIGELAVTGSSTPTPTVEVEITQDEGGMVTSSPAGISCPGVCSSSFAPGTEVTLTATPAAHSSVFSSDLIEPGEEPCPDAFPPALPSGSCQFTVSSDALWRILFSREEAEAPSGGSSNGGGAPSSATSTSPGPTPAAPQATKPKPTVLKCRKGFKKQKVRGKLRCVKVRTKHRRSSSDR